VEAEAEQCRRIAELRDIAFLGEQRAQIDRDPTLGEEAQAVETLERDFRQVAGRGAAENQLRAVRVGRRRVEIARPRCAGNGG
jgi:hypothetical protein